MQAESAERCPLLGLKGDPATTRAGVSDHHVCRRQPDAPLPAAQQRRYCLANEHTQCPVYTGEQRLRAGRSIGRVLTRRLAIVAVVLGVIAAGAAFVGWQYKQAYDELNEARALLRANADRLDEELLDLDANELAAVQADFARASARIASAKERLDRDPLYLAAGWLPGLSQQKDGLEELISLADGLATAGMAGVRTLQVLPSDAQSEGVGRELIAISESHRGDIGLVASEAAEAIRASSELEDDDLIGPLGDARDELLGYRRDLDDLYTMASFALLAPTLLGADGSTSYLVLGMNSGELMPGGGFIGNYAVFDLAQGEVQDIQGEDVYQLYDRWTQSPDFVRVDPPPALERYLLGEEWSWALGEAAWYPDFPTTASAAQEFVRLGGVGTTDATVGLTVPAMEELLRLTGPIELPEFGITFRAEDVGLRLSFDITHDEAGVRLFAAFMREMSNRLMALERSSWRSAWEVVRGLVDREELFINFADSDVQKRVAELGWDGRLPPPSGEQRILLTDASVRSTKLNFALQRQARLVIDLSGDRPRHRLRVTYRNAYSEWAAGKDPALAQQVLGPTNMLGNYIQLFAPAGSELLRLVEVLRGGAAERDLPPEPEEEQLGYSVFATFLPVRPDSERTVEFEYELPAGSSAQVHGDSYRLELQKQPGVPAYPIDILIVPPDGRVVERIEVCAPTRDACASQTGASLSTELDADLTLGAQFGER